MTDTGKTSSSTAPSEAQVDFVKRLKDYKDADEKIPTSTADKTIDWTAVDPVAKVGELYPDLAVAASPGGGGLVRLNGTVDIKPQALQMISDEQRNALIWGLKNKDNPKGKEILQTLGSSPQLRLRFPENAEQGKSFVANQMTGLNSLGDFDELKGDYDLLVSAASQSDLYRLYDLANGYGSGSPGDPTRRARSLEFALRMKPDNLPDLVCLFEFYNATCEVDAMEAAKTRIKEQEDKDKKRMSKNQMSKVRKAERERVGLQDSNKDGTLGDGVFEAVEAKLDDYKRAVTDLGFGVGPIPCAYDEVDPVANRGAIRAQAMSLQFGAANSIAYHTLKHFGELPPSARDMRDTRTEAENKVHSYYTAARNEVRITAESKVQFGQMGGEKHVFKTGNMRAIAWLNAGGTGLATYTT